MSNNPYHLIIDLEATCSNDGLISRNKTEIIEIGAVMLAEPMLQIVSEFQIFVRPIIYPVLTHFCTELTTIKQQDVDSAPSFKEALELMANWLREFGDFDVCSWGNYDKKQLEQDCLLHGINLPFEMHHRNLKQEFADFLNLKRGMGLKRALENLGIPLLGTHHRGIDDARAIAQIYKYLYLERPQKIKSYTRVV